MAVVTFYTNGKEETGNTVSAMALATYMGITKNKKTLLISTALNDNTIREGLWPNKVKKMSGLFGPNTNAVADNGIEGLDRVIRSNKISPNIITDYTKVALKDRLEILMGYSGSEEQYKMIQEQYPQIVALASRYYDMVIIDIDKGLELKTQREILNLSNVVIAMTTQNMSRFNNLVKTISQGVILNPTNTLIALGKYDDKLKYNTKNISRNVLKQKEIINAIPYNSILFEAAQEGLVIDMFIKFLSLKIRDENSVFLDEIKKLDEDIEKKVKNLQMRK